MKATARSSRPSFRKFLLRGASLVLLGLLARPAFALDLVVAGSDGKPVADADAALLFKSGAYQKAQQENGVLKFEPFTGSASLLVAAPGHESLSRNITHDEKLSVTLRPSTTRSSQILFGKTELPGKGGDIKVVLGDNGKNYISTFGIGLKDGSKLAKQPFIFRLRETLSAVDSKGNTFKIYVMELTPPVALIEYSN